MATVTLYNHKNFVAGGRVVEDNRLHAYSTTATNDTLQLPLNSDQNFSFRLVNTGTQAVAITAQTGETVTGAVSVAAGDSLTVLKTGSTTWVGVEVGTNLTA